MQNLVHQRCFNHSHREAAALCPECGRVFCRECVTEHEDRVVCAACLRLLAPLPLLKRRGWARLVQLGQCLISGLMLWFGFYLIGEGLASVPDAFHQGTLWKPNWLDQE